jgi:hypothetical protein
MAVDETGAAHIVWPTVVTQPALRGRLFYAVTRDGRTFTPRQEIPTLGGPKPTHPQIAIGPDGRAVIAWDELHNGTRTAASVSARVESDGRVTFGPVTRLSTGPPATYPVLAASSRGIVAAWTTGLAGSSSIATRRLQSW